MQKDIIQKIDLLVEMSDTNNHYETLKEELKLVELDISKQKDTQNELSRVMQDTRYMRASDRLIDENIKISLENKLASYQVEMDQIVSQIKEISLEEEDYHQVIVSLEEELNTSKKFLSALELKLKTIGGKDKSVYTFYEDLIDITNKDIQNVDSKLQDKRSSYEQIRKRLESYGESRVTLEDKIKKCMFQLEETKSLLENPKSYIDENSRKQDEESLIQIGKSLESLENRRLEILHDPSYIGHEATEFLFQDDISETILKVKELVSIVKSKPYMDYKNEDLDEILENAILKRDEFASSIEDKKYDSSNSVVLENRSKFLEECRENKLTLKQSLMERIRYMDTTLVKKIMDIIRDAKSVRDNLKDDIEEYKRVMEEDNEYKTPKKKASLNAAFHHKCDELEQVSMIVSLYEKDLEDVVSSSKYLEEKELERINKELQVIDSELSSIHKSLVYNNYPMDILQMEKDKSELKKLSLDVDKIMHRKKYLKTPDEIFDEIEITLNAFDHQNEDDIDDTERNPDDYRIDSSFDEDALNINEKNENEAFSSLEEREDVSLDSISFEDESVDDENLESFPPRNSLPKRFKVVHIEPLEDVNSSEDDFMVNDFEDTDYISFNDLLEGGMNRES